MKKLCLSLLVIVSLSFLAHGDWYNLDLGLNKTTFVGDKATGKSTSKPI